MSCCRTVYECFCSLEDAIRFLWNEHPTLVAEMPATTDSTTNRFDTDGTMYGTCSHYAYLQDVGEISSRSTNIAVYGVHRYRLWIITCDKNKRDRISNYVTKTFGTCVEVNTEEGNITRIEVSRPTKSYDAEESVFLAAMNLTVSYSLRRQCCPA